jgi:hypothetical protein
MDWTIHSYNPTGTREVLLLKIFKNSSDVQMTSLSMVRPIGIKHLENQNIDGIGSERSDLGVVSSGLV